MKLFLYSFFLLLSLNLAAQTKIDSKSQVPAITQVQSTPKFAQLSEISSQAVKVQEEIAEIAATLIDDNDAVLIQNKIAPLIKKISTLINDPILGDIEQLNIRLIQKKNIEFSSHKSQLEEWGKLLNTQIIVYDKKQKILEERLQYWNDTKEQAKKNLAPAAILKQIDIVILEITKVKSSAKKQFDILLVDSNLITTTTLDITKIMKKLAEGELTISNKFFTQNEISLFAMMSEKAFAPVSYVSGILKITSENSIEFKKYLLTHGDRIWLFLFSFLLITIFVSYFNYLYRKKRLFTQKDSLNKKVFFFIKRPFSTLLLITALLNVTVMFPNMPKVVSDIHLLFILLPIFRIIQTVAPQKLLKYFYIFFALHILYLFQKNAIGYTLDGRIVSILLSSALIVFNFQIIKKKLLDEIVRTNALKAVYSLFAISIFFLFISIFANIYGAILLSNKILGSIFIIIYSSLIFYTLSIILTGYIIIILRRHMATATNLIEAFSIKVERNTTLSIRLIMFAWWFQVTLKNIGIYPFLIDLKDQLLSFSMHIAATTISVQSLVDFILIVVGTWLISKFSNAILEVEIFSRFSLPRGVPTAIKTIINYAIIISGTIIALSTIGVTPEQFTLVFGALGVGIGFGLRNIIANFVSGIIMVFERPVQIGDTIQVEKTMGTVKSIGARSSTIETFDGSEVIIPNADFIAKEIVNWTLSDERRRKVLEFKVDFDSDIEQVMDIMKSVAISHQDVLKDPEPLATFNGFGEYHLNFKLYFWLTENLIVAQSDIAIGVYNALKEANINMPIPKQEVKKI